MLRLRRQREQPLQALSEEIETLSRKGRDPDTERRLLRLRHEAGLKLLKQGSNGSARYPEPAFDRLPDGSPLPEIPASELTPDLLRAAILRNGCLLVRGFLDRDDANRLVEGIDRAYAAREGESPDERYYDEFEPDERFPLAFERGVLRGA